MNILFDLTYISTAGIAGVHNYVYRLLSGIKIIDRLNDVTLLVSDENKKILVDHDLSDFRSIVIKLKHKGLIDRIPHLRGRVNRNSIEKIISDNKIDILFSPYLTISSLYSIDIQNIGVLHDAQTHIIKRGQPVKGMLFRFCMARILNRLSHIVTISQYAKESIIEIVNPKPTITVIYNSITICDSETINNKQHNCQDAKDILEKYILYVNTLTPYKNIATLIKAFAILANDIPHKLYIKGNPTDYWRSTIIPLIEKCALVDRVVLIPINYNNAEMAALYYNAALFVSPSIMEGFGFTPIEAAMYKVPVITSKESALPEVTMELLNYYEPATDEHALAECILRNLVNPPSPQQLHEIASIYGEKYSPKRQARELLNLFYYFIYNDNTKHTDQ